MPGFAHGRSRALSQPDTMRTKSAYTSPYLPRPFASTVVSYGARAAGISRAGSHGRPAVRSRSWNPARGRPRAPHRRGGTSMIHILRGLARIVFILLVVGVIGGGAVIGITLSYFGRDLPSSQQLASYVPATGTKVYAGDGGFMAEFVSERRIIVPIGRVPRQMIDAVLAAEDRDFYSHNGVNPVAVFRAAMADIVRYQRGQRPLGASTITQQVVRHFLLNNEVSVSRKIKEALLAYRIEHELSKERILEIYLNEIYLGAGAYGVAAAAEAYYQKPLDRLSPAEAAFLAALPKAPNNYHPQ